MTTSNDTKGFDSKEAIQEHISTLDGFHELIKKRYAWSSESKCSDRLQKWIVMGRYILTENGQVGLLIGDGFYKRPVDVDPNIPSVVSLDAWAECHPKGTLSWSHLISDNIPRQDVDWCPVCERSWTIDNVHDVVRTRYGEGRDRPMMHKACADAYVSFKEDEEFRAIFKEAGYKLFSLTPIDNGYFPPAYHKDDSVILAPWFKAKTHDGEFTVGWRKRVISITYPGEKSTEDLFPSEDVTKVGKVIHAWGTEKAVEYIRKMRQSLSKENQHDASV